jgi:hypothetical protein
MTPTRAAASSIASGRRSSRSHSRPIISSVRSCGVNSARRWRARATNSRRASSGSSGSSLHTRSPYTSSTSRLVATIRTFAHEASNVSASLAHASTTCSQLSRTSSRSRLARCWRRTSIVATPRGLRRSSTRAVSPATSGVPGPAARSTSHTPSGRLATCRRASSRARRVLPTPPGPLSVTRRALRRASPIPSSSRTRPTREVVGAGRLWDWSVARLEGRDAVDGIVTTIITSGIVHRQPPRGPQPDHATCACWPDARSPRSRGGAAFAPLPARLDLAGW